MNAALSLLLKCVKRRELVTLLFNNKFKLHKVLRKLSIFCQCYLVFQDVRQKAASLSSLVSESIHKMVQQSFQNFNKSFSSFMVENNLSKVFWLQKVSALMNIILTAICFNYNRRKFSARLDCHSRRR